MSDAKEIYAQIVDDIDGRIAIGEDEAILLADTVAGSSIHIEVGTLWGGTAILAALAGAGLVYSIDSMNGGHWKRKDQATGRKPSMASMLGNFARFGVADKIQFIAASSYPFPLLGVQPGTFFVDGDHTYKGCSRDWQTASRITRRAILVHDCHPGHPGVCQVIEEVAKEDKAWRKVEQVESLMLFERVT